MELATSQDLTPQDLTPRPHDSQCLAQERRVDWRWAMAVASGTSLLFFLGYGGASYLTSLRQDVGTWYYDWERFIPFVPAMIIPYMSIDALFVLAPFLCRDRDELRVLALRLSAVVLLATGCFLVYPLQLAVPRPHAEGFFGAIYNWFTQLDRPYNLCPSMHIALRTVLAVHFSKHCRGIVRLGMNVWFCLIGLSTLLLYQHHFIDVVGGFVLGVGVMYVFDGLPWRLPKVGGLKFAAGYGVLGLALLAPLAWKPALGWITLWPATSCLIVASGYAWFGPAIYRRCEGRIAWPAKLILGPVLLGQWLSWRHYARQSSMFTEVADGVWIGRHLREIETHRLAEQNIHAIVDVCVAFEEPRTLRQLNRLELPILDLTAPTPQQIETAVKFIEQHRGEGVLIHCKAGYSRSAAIIAAWLVHTGRAPDSRAAFDRIRQRRPQIVVRPEIRRMPAFRPSQTSPIEPCPASTI